MMFFWVGDFRRAQPAFRIGFIQLLIEPIKKHVRVLSCLGIAMYRRIYWTVGYAVAPTVTSRTPTRASAGRI